MPWRDLLTHWAGRIIVEDLGLFGLARGERGRPRASRLLTCAGHASIRLCQTRSNERVALRDGGSSLLRCDRDQDQAENGRSEPHAGIRVRGARVDRHRGSDRCRDRHEHKPGNPGDGRHERRRRVDRFEGVVGANLEDRGDRRLVVNGGHLPCGGPARSDTSPEPEGRTFECVRLRAPPWRGRGYPRRFRICADPSLMTRRAALLSALEDLPSLLCGQMPPQVVDPQGNTNQPQTANEKSRKNKHQAIMPGSGRGRPDAPWLSAAFGSAAWIRGRLRVEPVVHELNDEAELALAQRRRDLAHDPLRAPDRDPLTNLERQLARQVPSRDDLLATTKLVSISDVSHDRSKLQARADATALPPSGKARTEAPQGVADIACGPSLPTTTAASAARCNGTIREARRLRHRPHAGWCGPFFLGWNGWRPRAGPARISYENRMK